MRMINNLKGARPPKIISDLRDLVKSGADVFGDKTLYFYKENGATLEYSFKKLYDETLYIGTGLAKLGLMGKGISVIGHTHPRYTATYISTVNGGGYIVPVDPELTNEQTAFFMNHAEVEAVFYTEKLADKINEIKELLPNVKLFVAIQPSPDFVSDDKNMTMDDLVELGKTELEGGYTEYIDYEIEPEKLAAIIFTSGSTGTAKGVMLSTRNLTAATNASCLSMSYDDRNTFVSVLPPHHTYEMTCGHLALMNIGAQVLLNDSLKHVMKNFKEFKPNALALVPLFVETMHKKIWAEVKKKGIEGKLKFAMGFDNVLLSCGIDVRRKLFKEILDSFGGNLASIVCGGAPLSPQLIKDFYAFGITVLEGYGITECAPLVAVNSPGKIRFHSVGQPVKGCKVMIDKTPGEETGEILVKGDNVMMGYYKNPEATKEVFTDDGWFRTGDIGWMDKDGYIYITGRKKNVIILSNGKNVFPEEIEEYLVPIEIILESVVMARNNDQGEPTITAIVVPNMQHLEGKTDEEIYEMVKAEIGEVNKKLPSYKQIHRIEIRKEEFERTTSKKIQRFKIK
ncbi:MAG: long-chain fatty acid--CoA ligase [Ruminococcaceae bacterium]|nr:long-chain fatty acid--CoA ligase [Oscillospiraceae bacterium]